jgi:hypothetical protein
MGACRQGLLSYYGAPIAEYHGSGVLTLTDGTRVDCEFEAGQLTTGSVLLFCISSRIRGTNSEAIKFEGTTSENFEVTAQKHIVFSEAHYSSSAPTQVIFLLRQLFVSTAKNNDARTARFGLTNFEFSGTEPVTKSDGSAIHQYLALPLSLQHNNVITNLCIHPINGYQEVIQRVRTLRSIDVTCEVVADIPKGPTGKDLTIVTDVVDNLCYILSVARGTKIQWIYLDEYNAAEKRISRTHCSRVTKPFCSLPVIRPDVSDRKATKGFIECAYSIYVDRKKDWRLNQGTIDAYLEGKAEHDYLELRGVKLVVAMEMLKSVFSKLSSSPKCESFGEFIEKMCNYIGLKPNPKDIERFIKSRNALIHTGNFCSTTKQERRKEYFFLVNFLDNVFLRLLDYEEPWVDLEPWAKAAEEAT